PLQALNSCRRSHFFSGLGLRPRTSLTCRNFEEVSRKPYRGFESLSLRHAVWAVEKFLNVASRNARNGRNSAIHTLKPDQRKRPANPSMVGSDHFSLDSRNAVRFRRGAVANAVRSQTDHVAKAD